MSKLFSLKHSLELLAALIALVALAQVLYQFIVGQHYIIPTMILVPCILFGNLARHGLLGAAWAKHILFWFGCVLSCLLFFALFFAQTPPRILGAAFLPVFIPLFAAMVFLTTSYKKRNNIRL